MIATTCLICISSMLRLEYGSSLRTSLKLYDLPISQSQAKLDKAFGLAKMGSGNVRDAEVIDVAVGYLANWFFHLESIPLAQKKQIKQWLEIKLPQLKKSAESAALTTAIFNTDPPRPGEFDLSNVQADPLVANCILTSFSNYRIKTASDMQSADRLLTILRASHAHPGLMLYAESGVLMEKYFFTKKLDYLEQAVAKREATMKIDTRADEVEFSKPFLEYWKAKIAKKKKAGGGG